MSAAAADEPADLFDESVDAQSDEGPSAPAVFEALSSGQQATLRDLFSVFDQQGRGYMHPSELRIALRMAECEVSRDEAYALTATHCRHREFGFTMEEFLLVVDELVKSRPKDFREKYLAETFDLLDAEGNGAIGADDIARWGSVVREAETAAEATTSRADARKWESLHAAPSQLTDVPLDVELLKPGGIDRFMKELGFDPQSNISREVFISMLLNSDTII